MKGNLNPVISHFRKEMDLCAENMEFEKAAQYRDAIAALRKKAKG